MTNTSIIAELRTCKTLILIIAMMSLFGCDDDDDNCISDMVVAVDTIEAVTDTGVVNTPVNITVNFTVNNGCGAFNRFIENRAGNVITIDVEARFTGCICTMALKELSANYSFVANTPGDYELRFSTENNQFIPLMLSID
jgi:hypothetical protein